MPMGADVVSGKMLSRIVDIEEVSDAVLMLRAAPPGGAATEIYRQNIATSGRKASVASDGVFVGLMEELIHIDVRVQLEPVKTATPSAVPARTAADNTAAATPAAPATLSAAEQTAIIDAIHAAIESADGSLQTQALKDAASKAMTNPAAFRMNVVMNAEYEETGRLLYDTAQVSAAGNELL